MIAISASSLSLSFGDTVILKDITFAAQDGEHIGIVGTNGAGKTSLFRLLSGEKIKRDLFTRSPTFLQGQGSTCAPCVLPIPATMASSV